MMKTLKRLTYRREIRSLTGLLGLSATLRKLYYRFAQPRDDILRLKAGKTTAEFRIHTSEELRFLEAMELYERRVFDRLMEAVKPGDVVYDIGANVGLYAVPLAKEVGNRGQVIAFEPERTSYNHLQENLKLNALNNVRSFRKALGERNGEATIYLGEVGNLSLLPPDTRDMNRQVVEMVEGDWFREAENLPLPRAIKIDVEGYEYAVLEGLRRTLAHPQCEMVVCEIHPTLLPAKVQPEAVLDLLKSLGFTCMDTFPGWHVSHAVAHKVTSSIR
jgi:FkbM family methyltransferase